MDKIKLLIVDNDEANMEHLIQLIENTQNIIVAGTATTGYDGILEAVILNPDVILMADDIEAPKSGIIAACALIDRFPSFKVIIMTDHKEMHTLTSPYNKIYDHLCKKSSPSHIIDIIQKVDSTGCSEYKYLHDNIRIKTDYRDDVKDSLMFTLNAMAQLTPSEIEITKLILDNYSFREIACIRSTSMDTIKVQIERILHKFNKATVNDLVRVIHKLNIIEFLGDSVC